MSPPPTDGTEDNIEGKGMTHKGKATGKIRSGSPSQRTGKGQLTSQGGGKGKRAGQKSGNKGAEAGPPGILQALSLALLPKAKAKVKAKAKNKAKNILKKRPSAVHAPRMILRRPSAAPAPKEDEDEDEDEEKGQEAAPPTEEGEEAAPPQLHPRLQPGPVVELGYHPVPPNPACTKCGRTMEELNFRLTQKSKCSWICPSCNTR